MQESIHCWLPIIFAIYMPVSIFITYGISVAKHHVEAWFPYISDTGTYPPESCIFAQLFNIGALIAFIVGFSSALGVSIVGNFQETNIIVVHYIGSTLAFGVGFVYMVLQTVISYKLTGGNGTPGNTLCVRRVRLIFCLVDFVLLVLVMAQVANAKRRREGVSLNWTSDRQGFDEHIVATVSEWLISFVTVAFLGTFYSEFKHFKIRPPQIVYNAGVETVYCQLAGERDSLHMQLSGEQVRQNMAKTGTTSNRETATTFLSDTVTEL